MARLTKKELVSHVNDRFITVEFYHGQRNCYTGGCDLLSALNTQLRTARRGGICFLFDYKYNKLLWQFISEREGSYINRFPLDEFRSSLPVVLKNFDEAINGNIETLQDA